MLIKKNTTIIYKKHTIYNIVDKKKNTTILFKNQIFYFTPCITPKRITGLQGPFLRHCTGQHSSFQRNVAAVESRWQHCLRFDRPEI